MKLVLFDCDGTLADSFGLICEAMRRTFAAHDLPVPGDAATQAIIGLSLDSAILRLYPECPPKLLPLLVAAYRLNFRAAREDAAFRETLFAGIPALLADLSGRETLRLGLVTGKTRRGVDAVVATHGLEGVFLAIRTADDCPSKPHPAMVLECCEALGVDPAETLVVGDAVFDMQMAVAAGASALGVAWGASAPLALSQAGAYEVAADVAEMGTLIDGWLAGETLSARAPVLA
ncbi:HAD-IA family hydrolase [Aureimonas glaciei]|uniref:Phosphoglycolate phosphatase n=1 Tax=Aureimonas glaciei TaxID=1776957 RepID=A0A916YC97_9HYPH|nr:HAD-IA family hydrolase [Aureimonas glaciei]GGD39003.1 phosphoglycolate phosphatase [Aureimonas glaciei]